MNKTALAVLVVLVVVAGGVLFFTQCGADWCRVTEWQRVQAADSFDRCAELGFPVAESYPRQCRAGDKAFTETVSVQPVANDKIRVTSPLPNESVRSPFLVRGEARGSWYFEASFSVRILDAVGKELGVVPAQAQGEWMTTEFVPFEARLTFTTPTTPTGVLVLEKDNPSGLPEHADEIRIPIRFAEAAGGANAGTQATLRGKLACLPHRGPGPHTMECAYGLRAENGTYYGLDATNLGPNALFEIPFDRSVSVAGTLILAEERPDLSAKYDIQGVVRVATITQL